MFDFHLWLFTSVVVACACVFLWFTCPFSTCCRVAVDLLITLLCWLDWICCGLVIALLIWLLFVGFFGLLSFFLVLILILWFVTLVLLD